MRTGRWLLALSLAVAPSIAGCSSSSSGHSGAPGPATASWPQGTPAAQRIQIVNDPAALASRLHVQPRAIGLRAQSAPIHFGPRAPDPSQVSLQWVAQLDPPQAVPEIAHYGTAEPPDPTTPVPLYAVTVSIAANVGLVTYMLTGDAFAGAIDVLDVTDPSAPVLRASAIFKHMNIASATLVPDDATSGSGTVYVAAATCDPQYAGTALLERIRLDQFQLNADVDYRMPLFGGSGEGVSVAGNRVYGTAGLHGGLRAFDSATGALLGEAPVDVAGGDARWVSVEGGLAAVVAGGSAGRLDIFDASTLAQVGSFPFDGASIPESKSTVQLVRGRAFVAAGPGGMQVLSAKTGALLGKIPVPSNTGYAPADVVTNAVSVDGDLVFMANGGPGVYVAESASPIAESDSETPFRAAWVTAIDIQGSVNHVSFRGRSLLVASGASGLQIIRVN